MTAVPASALMSVTMVLLYSSNIVVVLVTLGMVIITMGIMIVVIMIMVFMIKVINHGDHPVGVHHV